VAQGKKTVPEIRAYIFNCVVNGLGIAETQRALEEIPDFQDRVPSLPTVSRYHREAQLRTGIQDDELGGFTWNGIDGEDARLALDALARVIEKSQGRKTSFSDAEARWVVWARHAAPGLDPWKAWIIARSYWSLDKMKDPNTAALDAYLALKPWESDEALGSYKGLLDSGSVQDTLMGWLLWNEKLHWRPSGLKVY
jgi:hypothetical protein